MSVAFKTDPADGQFLVEILALLDVDENNLPPPETPQDNPRPKPTLRTLRPRANSDSAVKPKRVRKETTPRVRNKAKIELLRLEIKGLEAVLASLQSSRRGETTLERRRAGSMWRIIAMRQGHQRQLAEHRNVRLKRMLAQQYTLTKSLINVIGEWRDLSAPELTLSACI